MRSLAYIGVFSCLLACSSSGTSGALHDYGPAELYAGTAGLPSSAGTSGDGATNSAGAATGGTASAGVSNAGASNGGASNSAGGTSGGASNAAGTSSGGSSNDGAAGQGGSSTGGSSTGGASTGTEQILSRGKPATADSEQAADGNGAAMGNDGALSTRWCAADAATGHYWQVDLGASHTLTRLAVSWEKVEVYQFKVEGSADRTSWTTLTDQTTSTDDSSDQSFPLTGAPSARYVKVTVTGLNGGAWASFFEFSVYGY